MHLRNLNRDAKWGWLVRGRLRPLYTREKAPITIVEVW